MGGWLCPPNVLHFFPVRHSARKSHKVIWRRALHLVRSCRISTTPWRRVVKLLNGMSAALVHLDDRREVPAAVAVVRCREHGHDTVVVHPVESLHDQLVRPCDELQTICVVELLRDVLPKRVPCTSRRDSPTTPVLWVTPQKVADRTFVRNFREAVKCVDVVDGVEARAKPGVCREDLALHARGEWQVVEKVGDERPNARGSIFPQALVVEAINLFFFCGGGGGGGRGS